jgi:hypothetical protein
MLTYCAPLFRNLFLGHSPLGQFGLFAPQEGISKGSFICTYAGELLSTTEARQRWARQAERGQGNYIFSLRERGRETIHIDPTRIGGIGFVLLSLGAKLAKRES